MRKRYPWSKETPPAKANMTQTRPSVRHELPQFVRTVQKGPQSKNIQLSNKLVSLFERCQFCL